MNRRPDKHAPKEEHVQWVAARRAANGLPPMEDECRTIIHTFGTPSNQQIYNARTRTWGGAEPVITLVDAGHHLGYPPNTIDEANARDIAWALDQIGHPVPSPDAPAVNLETAPIDVIEVVLDTALAVADYPVLNDDTHQDVIDERNQESWKAYGRVEVLNAIAARLEDTLPEEIAHDIAGHLVDNLEVYDAMDYANIAGADMYREQTHRQDHGLRIPAEAIAVEVIRDATDGRTLIQTNGHIAVHYTKPKNKWNSNDLPANATRFTDGTARTDHDTIEDAARAWTRTQ